MDVIKRNNFPIFQYDDDTTNLFGKYRHHTLREFSVFFRNAPEQTSAQKIGPFLVQATSSNEMAGFCRVKSKKYSSRMFYRVPL